MFVSVPVSVCWVFFCVCNLRTLSGVNTWKHTQARILTHKHIHRCPGTDMWWGGGHVRSSSCDKIECACRQGFGISCGPVQLEHTSGGGGRVGGGQRGAKLPPPTPHDLFDIYLPYSSEEEFYTAEEEEAGQVGTGAGVAALVSSAQ